MSAPHYPSYFPRIIKPPHTLPAGYASICASLPACRPILHAYLFAALRQGTSAQPPRRASSEEVPGLHADPDFFAMMSHPLAVMSHPALAHEMDPSMEPPDDSRLMDLPSSRQRVRRSRKLDVLGGKRPPPFLLPLLSNQGYLQGVLSRLPDVNPENAALKAGPPSLMRCIGPEHLEMHMGLACAWCRLGPIQGAS